MAWALPAAIIDLLRDCQSCWFINCYSSASSQTEGDGAKSWSPPFSHLIKTISPSSNLHRTRSLGHMVPCLMRVAPLPWAVYTDLEAHSEPNQLARVRKFPAGIDDHSVPLPTDIPGASSLGRKDNLDDLGV